MLHDHTDGANMKWIYFTFTFRLRSLLLCQVFNTTTLHGTEQEGKQYFVTLKSSYSKPNYTSKTAKQEQQQSRTGG
jgi:hypothetical protein